MNDFGAVSAHDAVPVTVFDVEIDEKGQIQLTETLFDVETNLPKKAVTAIEPEPEATRLRDRPDRRRDAE